MAKVLSPTKGAGKLSMLSKLWGSLDKEFKEQLQETENQNCLFQLLSILDVEADMITSFMDIVIVGEYYDLDRQVFIFDGQALGVILEDVLHITGLPIQGEPVLFRTAFDDQAFSRVFGKFTNMTIVSVKDIMDIAADIDKSYQTRKIAVLLTILFAFIAPTNNKHEVDSVCVQFIENLDKIDQYAWGAALLAYMYYGIWRYKKEKKGNVDGNLWILLVFFIIRLKKFQNALVINLEDPPQYVRDGDPWLKWIVHEIKKKSHDHYTKYHIKSMLPLWKRISIGRPMHGWIAPEHKISIKLEISCQFFATMLRCITSHNIVANSSQNSMLMISFPMDGMTTRSQ